MKIRSFFRKIDWVNHLFTFGGTLLGVLIAFYLSNYHENKRNEDRLEQAMTNIYEELENNKENTESHADTLALNIQVLEYLEELMDSTYDLITTQSKADELLREYPRFLKIDGKTFVKDSLYDFDLTLNLNFNMLQVSDIAWTSALAADILHLVDYQKSLSLHSIYRIQKNIYDDSQAAIDLLKGAIKETEHKDISKLIFREYYSQIKLAYQFEQGLVKAYNSILEQWNKP